MIPIPSFSLDHIHPILVNFTAALVPASVGSDFGGRLFRKQSLHQVAFWTLVYAAAITPLTAISGLVWKSRIDAASLPPEAIAVHQWLGITLAVTFILLGIWRWNIYRREQSPGLLYLLFTAIAVLALIYQGTLGGGMAFGGI